MSTLQNSVTNQAFGGVALGNSMATGAYVSSNTVGHRILSAEDFQPKIKKIGFEVQEAENGYVIRYAYKDGEYYKTKVAKDMEEVRDLVTSILVERKLGI